MEWSEHFHKSCSDVLMVRRTAVFYVNALAHEARRYEVTVKLLEKRLFIIFEGFGQIGRGLQRDA